MVKVFYLTFLVSGFEVNASSFEPSACSLHRTLNRVDWLSQLVLLSYLSGIIIRYGFLQLLLVIAGASPSSR